MRQLVVSFHRDWRGATSVEYALLIALVALLSVLALGGIGGGLKAIFQKVTTYL